MPVPELVRLLGSFVCGLLLGQFSHWLAFRRESANRRRQFRVKINQCIREFVTFDTSKRNPGSLVEVHLKTIQPITDACINIDEDISRTSRGKFRLTWKSYCGFKRGEIEPYDGATMDHVQEHGFAGTFPNHSKGVSIMVGSLETLIECSE